MRHKGIGGNLSAKGRIPSSRNAGTAGRAATSRSEMVSPNEIPVARNEEFLTVVTTRVLPVADHARQISGIDVTQPSLLADFCCPYQRLRPGVFGIHHFVVFMKSRHVSRNIRRDARQ